MKKKTKENDILEDMTPALIMGGLGIGSAILGEPLTSKLPTGMTNPLSTTGTTLGTFTKPVVVLGAMSTVTRQLKKVEKKMKRKK